jgi:drug/metabolite transporter (DMT)-like permease
MLGIFYNGVLGSGVVYIIYSHIMPLLSPATAGLILACEPVFTTLAASAIPILGKTEPIGLIQVAGGTLILGTIVVVQGIMNRQNAAGALSESKTAETAV